MCLFLEFGDFMRSWVSVMDAEADIDVCRDRWVQASPPPTMQCPILLTLLLTCEPTFKLVHSKSA